MVTQPRVLLLLLLCLHSTLPFGLFSRSNGLYLQKQFSSLTTTPRPRQGALKLCPPGGSSFFDAFNIICTMKRRKRRSADIDIQAVMNKCCETGCEYHDIFRVCNPFSF